MNVPVEIQWLIGGLSASCAVLLYKYVAAKRRVAAFEKLNKTLKSGSEEISEMCKAATNKEERPPAPKPIPSQDKREHFIPPRPKKSTVPPRSARGRTSPPRPKSVTHSKPGHYYSEHISDDAPRLDGVANLCEAGRDVSAIGAALVMAEHAADFAEDVVEAAVVAAIAEPIVDALREPVSRPEPTYEPSPEPVYEPEPEPEPAYDEPTYEVSYDDDGD